MERKIRQQVIWLQPIMNNQVSYYNRFGKQFEQSILDCPEPALWTTDYAEKGRVYQEMKIRVEQQKILIIDTFTKEEPVLDIGCGFGRQAFLLAQMGFTITGTDTSDVFIAIAKKLFDKHGYKGRFYCIDLLKEERPSGLFKQLLLLDVLEHIRPFQRRKFIKQIFQQAMPDAKLIISLPHVKKRLRSQLNNKFRKEITQHFTYFTKREEHPYPIPGEYGILKYTQGLFRIESKLVSRETDYYILRKV
jgi:2-polyprenyl-3-methyl-5-hydroxy-6-metoxy-1,4-benzoquinol methylase